MIPQRILVTGGAGFIGSHTVALLLSQEKQVVVLDNLSSGKLTHLDLAHPNLEFIEGDVLEYPLVADLLSGCDAVLHLAAVASVPESIINPIYSFQVNVQGFLHVIEAVRQARHPIRLVYASSAAVYGSNSNLPSRDDIPLSTQPLSPYALHKMDNELCADLYARLYGIPSLGLRYFNVYGPGQDPHSVYSGVISRFIESYKQDKELIIYGDGQQSRDFIYVTDVAMANSLALSNSYTGVVNVATGQHETLLDLIQYIESVSGCTVLRRMEPARSGDIKASFAAIQTAEQHLGFKYTVSLQEGMKLLIG